MAVQAKKMQLLVKRKGDIGTCSKQKQNCIVSIAHKHPFKEQRGFLNAQSSGLN
jgi:hypothetical protein